MGSWSRPARSRGRWQESSGARPPSSGVGFRPGRTAGRVVRVFPVEWWEPLLLSGYRLDVWMQSGVTPANLTEHTAQFYRNPPPAGRVCAVLGAGNIGSIPPLDVLHKLYAEGQVVALKLSPVNDYLGPIYSEIFSDFIDRGFLRVLLRRQ